MAAVTFTSAATLVTAAADTAATSSKAHWSLGDQGVTITRRTLPGGKVRIRITLAEQAWLVRRASGPIVRTEVRDLSAADADALFAAQITKWNTYYLARLDRAGISTKNARPWQLAA